MLVQEVPVVQLVDTEGVADQCGPVDGLFDDLARRVEAGDPRHVTALRQFAPHAGADRDGRPVLLGGRHQGLRRAGRQDVVAVQEHDVRGGRGRHPVVAGVPQPPLFCALCTTFRRGWAAARASRTRPVPSVEASFTATTSRTTGPWARAEETASPTSPASLNAITTTVTVEEGQLFTRRTIADLAGT